ncbi:MAG: acyltransferase family protein [Caulobacteraceae bacterium]
MAEIAPQPSRTGTLSNADPFRAPLPLTRGGALDALRFLAAFFMVVYHYAGAGPVPLSQVHPLFARGYLATDFFIIVSGYVLGRIYGERVESNGIGAGGFFLRRAQRLVPAHLIMICAFIAMLALTTLVGIKPLHPEYLSWKDLPSELFLVQGFGVPGGEGWNSPTWSLSALLGCYALFPIIWRAQAKIRQPVVVLAMAVALLILADVASSRLIGRRIYEFPSTLGIGRAVPLFLVGVALARVSESVFIRPRLAVAMAVISASLLVGLQFVGRFDFLSIALISVLVAGAGAIPATKPSYLLEKGALVSFAIFITNEFVRNVWFGVVHVVARRHTFTTAQSWGLWWLALAVAIAFAVAFHYVVDMPTQRWIRKRRGPKPAAARKAATPRPAPVGLDLQPDYQSAAYAQATPPPAHAMAR